MACWMHMVALVITLSPQIVNSQIPKVCANANSLQNMECCPSDCGNTSGRGMCVDVQPLPDIRSCDVRFNWPHYFRRICQCNDNYGGYDCSRCKYGYYGSDCSMKNTIPRKNILNITDSELEEYIEILQMTRTYNSGYVVVLNESRPGRTNVKVVNDVYLYNLFIWLHHFSARDSECEDSDLCIKVDYAHEATGFPTWHRQYLLWLEWEIQYMLKSMNRLNYYEFRLNFWDWTDVNRTQIFTTDKLGENIGNSQVNGAIFNTGWDTICWYNGSGNVTEPRGTTCDPRNNTGPLQRCPTVDGDNPCEMQDNWPTIEDVEGALAKPKYDVKTYNKEANKKSFRNLLEGFETKKKCDNNLCVGNIQRHLHNTVHIIVGIGHFNQTLPQSQRGVMGDVAASPNDPLFINHHAMIDCILEEWLQRHPHEAYPNVPNEIRGHQREGYIVPFFPLYKHSDVFKTADNFGYSCEIEFPNTAVTLTKPFHLVVMCSVAILFY